MELRELVNIGKVRVYADKRGTLYEILNKKELVGNILCLCSKNGEVRGNHYHNSKNEFFCVVMGKVRFYVRDIETGKEADGILDEGMIIEIPPKHSHALVSAGESVVVEFSPQPYNHNSPDVVEDKLVR